MHHLVYMAGIIGDARTLGDQINGLLIGTVMSVLCSAFVAITFATSRSVPKTFVAAIGAAIIWFTVMNMTVFRDKAGQDLKNPSSAMVIVQHRVDGLR
ncbi:hypothetical protein ABZ746_23245 [Streptomyces sp. NPDC020096]